MYLKKLVFESLNSFEKSKDPLSSLGVGKRKLIEDWLEEMKMRRDNYTINDDLSIDFKGFVSLSGKNLFKFPDYIQFNHVGGFSCNLNNLTSLRGCPRIVNGLFDCSRNKLTSLRGCPHIMGELRCYRNAKYFSVNDVVEKYDLICKNGCWTDDSFK
jgi:hypothetical protein